MCLYRIRNPRTLYNGMNAAITYYEDGKTETRWGTAWREEGGYPGDGPEVTARVEWAEDGYAPYHTVEDYTPEAESWIKIDLHDPVTALQILLRFRDVFSPGAMFYEEQDVLLDLLHDSPSALASRTTALNILLARLDAVPEVKEVGEPRLQNLPFRTEEGRRIRDAFVSKAQAEQMLIDYASLEREVLGDVSSNYEAATPEKEVGDADPS